MSDNTTLNPGAGGDVIASDDVGGIKYQMVKLDLGANGASAPVSGALPVSMTATPGLTDTQLRAAAVPVTGPLTDTQLRTSALVVADVGMLATTKQKNTAATLADYGQVILAQRRDSDTAEATADGQYTTLKQDEAGRLKVASQPAGYSIISGNIVAAAGAVVCDVSRASNVMLMLTAASLVGHNATFEGSLDSTNGADGTWFGIQAVRSNANTIETATGVLAATPAYAWEASVNGLAWVRVRATAHTSGIATWKIQRGTYATEPIPAAQVSAAQPVSGTVTANAGTLVTPAALNINSLATTNASIVKAAAGTLYNISASNSGAAAAFLKLYNQATAPTVGTSVPVLVIVLPAGATVDHDFGLIGHRFATGISAAITGAMADIDATAIAASQVKVLASFI